MDFPIALVFHYNPAMPIKKFRIQLDKPTGDFDGHPLRVNVIVAPMRTAIRDKIISPEVEAAFWAEHPERPHSNSPLMNLPRTLKRPFGGFHIL